LTIQPMPKKMTWTLDEVIDGSRGRLAGGARFTERFKSGFAGISIDSRSCGPQDMFAAIQGDIYDGHDFLEDVVKNGGRGLIVDENRVGQKIGKQRLEQWMKNGVAVVIADETVRSLGYLASFNLARSNARVAAVTGSNGKTSVKNMLRSIASVRFQTLATEGNLNNHIGLPLTVFRLSAFHEWAVLEMGMNHLGEIAYLASLCSPDIGIITNTGPAHLEGVGSMEGVVSAKGELLEKIRPGGVAILNADDPNVGALARKTEEKTLYFGFSDAADVRAQSIETTGAGANFTLVLPGGKIRATLSAPGRFMIANALAAAAAGHCMGISIEDIKTGLEQFQHDPGRMDIVQIGDGVTVINDTYNANPASMEAAMETLGELAGENRKFIVIGDMMELGKNAESMHRRVGSKAAEVGAERVWSAGLFAEAVARGAREGGMSPEKIAAGSPDQIVEDIKKYLEPGDWALVKGSRAMKMEKIVHRLRDAVSKQEKRLV